MHERLKALEVQSRQLDPNTEVFDGWMGQIHKFAGRFLAEIDNRPASVVTDVSAVRWGFKERGEELSAALVGQLHARFCILNFRTHLCHVEKALAEVAACIN